jgi:hypothetical protein
MQFIFQHNTVSILPFVIKATHYIKENVVAGHGDKEQLLNRCKFIITELCTNAIKHSGRHESMLKVFTSGNQLIIERSDNGHPFFISLRNMQLSFPLPQEVGSVILMEDDINRLTMQRIHEYSARFWTEQVNAEEKIMQQTLSEHFGLIIICLSSDSFVYTHAPEHNTNTFTATINLT